MVYDPNLSGLGTGSGFHSSLTRTRTRSNNFSLIHGLGWRPKLCLLGFLLSSYLVAFIFISMVNLDHGGTRNSATMNRNDGVGNDVGVEKTRLKGQIRPAFDSLQSLAFSSSRSLHPPPGASLRRVSSRLKWCVTQHFNPNPTPVTALASFPGSGNTWLRYLLQQATGIYTGSVYKDYALLKHGFPAESIVNGSVSVVKTHEWGEHARKPFDRVVLLVRDPSAAIFAEFNRQSGGHVGHAGLDKYKRNNGKYWWNFATQKAEAWERMTLDWLRAFTGPIYVLFYEDLTNNVEEEIRGVIKFLQLNVTSTDMECALRNREGIYKRKKRKLTFDPFTQNIKEIIQKHKDKVYKAIRGYQQQHKYQLVPDSDVTTTTTLQTTVLELTTEVLSVNDSPNLFDRESEILIGFAKSLEDEEEEERKKKERMLVNQERKKKNLYVFWENWDLNIRNYASNCVTYCNVNVLCMR